MKTIILFCLLGACLADKPSPTYNAAVSPISAAAPTIVAGKTVIGSNNAPLSSYAAPKSDNFADASLQPQATAKSDTGVPASSVVQQPATQGYYYYYYPVSSGQPGSQQQTYSAGGQQAYNRDGGAQHGAQHSGPHGGGGAPHGVPHGGVGGGGGYQQPQQGYAQPQQQGYGGGSPYGPGPGNGVSNLIVPAIVVAGIFFALLFFSGIAGNAGGFGRSFKDTLAEMDLGINVIDAIDMARNVLDAVNGMEREYA
jgi:hypothetical protein